MSTGIILAGGRGSRMGPLAAQISKALVSVGQQPHLVHQIQLMQRSDIEQIVVVASPETSTQISNMLVRSGLIDGIALVEQPAPMGPVNAIHVALELADITQPITVLMSDTYLDEPLLGQGDWVGTGPAPASRSFCFWDEDGHEFVDDVTEKGKHVTIGAYRFEDAGLLYALAASTVRANRHLGEVGMAPLLNAYHSRQPLENLDFSTWQDIGDVRALARARRNRFISRDHNTLTLSDSGIITKTGTDAGFQKQALWMQRMSTGSPRIANLVPRIYHVGKTSYMMEHVDLPTLAELWLYWPGRPDTWADIIFDTLTQVSRMWGLSDVDDYTDAEEFRVYAAKAVDRVKEYDVANDTQWSLRTTELIRGIRHRFVKDEPGVMPHGDLNWNNILFSLNTGAVKLIDPRGDDRLPMSYELAKMRYSYHGGFAAITHGLFTPYGTDLLPERSEETMAIDAVLQNWGADLNKIQACEGMLLLAAAPLHPQSEAEMLLSRGVMLLEGAQ